MPAPTQTQPLSLEEFLKLPEQKPAYEYINGKPHQKPMPRGKHSLLQTRLSALINRVAEPQQAAFALTELRCSFGGRSLVPDIAVFAWENIPLDETGDIADRFSIPPDWTIEILSPQQPQTRVIDNILFCLNSGTELGWLIDPDETTILVFRAGEQPQLQRNDDKLPGLSHVKGWEISVNQVFDLLKFRLPSQGN